MDITCYQPELILCLLSVALFYLPISAGVASSPLVLAGSVLILGAGWAACFLDSTTSGITASIKVKASMFFAWAPSYTKNKKLRRQIKVNKCRSWYLFWSIKNNNLINHWRQYSIVWMTWVWNCIHQYLSNYVLRMHLLFKMGSCWLFTWKFSITLYTGNVNYYGNL